MPVNAHRPSIVVSPFRQNLVGLSRRTVVMNFLCSFVIFLYLVDSDGTSRLIVGSMGVSMVIDAWKVGGSGA